MLQRPTQTAAFWRDQFEVTAEDLDFLYDLLLDAQAPKSVKELAIALIDEYIRRENAKIEAELSKGAMYMPKETYTVGQTLVFPALDFAVAEVTDVRAGQNPEHGEFQVIAVTFADGAAREFAAQDVLAAFDAFLSDIGEDRPFLIAGVGQGGLHAAYVLLERVAPSEDLRQRLIAAGIRGASA